MSGSPIPPHTIERIIVQKSRVIPFLTGIYVGGWGAFVWWGLVSSVDTIPPGGMNDAIWKISAASLLWPLTIPMGLFGIMAYRVDRAQKNAWK